MTIMRHVTSFDSGARFVMSAGAALRLVTENAASLAALSGERLSSD